MAAKNSTSQSAAGRWVAGLLVLSCCLVDAVSSQQQQKKRSDQDPDVIELRSDLASFTVSVIGGNGQALMNLKPEDFTIFENGERQKISHFATVDAPVDIVLAIDTSGSMQGNLEILRKAATNFIERMRPQDRLALVEFGREVTLSLDWTQQRKEAQEVIKAIKPKKPTATSFYDCLYVISDELLRPIHGRKAIVLLSDGVDSLSFYDYQQAAGVLERSGAAVYFIEIDTEEFTVRGLRKGDFTLSPQQLERYRRTFRPDDLPIRYRDPGFFFDDELERIARGLYKIARTELRQLAERTGGRVFPLKRVEDLSGIYSKIAAELGTLYSIGYYPSNSKHDGQWRAIRVEVSVPGAQALARSGYWAPNR